MNTILYKNITGRKVYLSLILIGMALLFSQCNEEAIIWEPDNKDFVITEYVEESADKELFTEFNEILKATGIDNQLSVRGPFTLFLPTNEAVFTYYQEHDINSYMDIDMKDLKTLVYNHIIMGRVNTDVIGLGSLPYENALGDIVASDLRGIDIYLNKDARISKRDISVSNGIVHHVDRMIEVITKSVYDVLAANTGYSIFVQGLDETGLADTLKISEFKYGLDTARNEYTVLAVPDSLYHRLGINSVDDLKNMYSDTLEVTNKLNGFNKYMVYHCLSGIIYFTDLQTSKSYEHISNDNYLHIGVDDDYKINETDTSYVGFYYDHCNIPAKNGVLHTIDHILPYQVSEATDMEFYVFDYFDFRQEPCFKEFYYERFYATKDTFQYIKWDADWLMYYTKDGEFGNDRGIGALHCKGHFWLEITTPLIRKGKYMMECQGAAQGNQNFAWYLDDKLIAEIKGSLDEIAEIEIPESKRYRLKVKTVTPSSIFWQKVMLDYLGE